MGKVQEIYDALKIPKNLDELYDRICETDLKWNKAQVKLFVELDKNIFKNGDRYSIESNNNIEKILDIIDNIIGEKPIIPITQILKNIPRDLVVDESEILKIALESKRYSSPNRKTLRKV